MNVTDSRPGGATLTSFLAVNTGRLRRAGLEGQHVRVEVQGGNLVLTGERSGRLEVPQSQVERMRVGVEESKHGRYPECRLWLPGDGGPLTLSPLQRGRPKYGDTVRAFARALAASGGIERIETGLSPASALVLPVAFGVLFMAAAGISLFALGHEPWWGRLMVPLVPGLLFGFGLWQTVTRSWPRRIRDLAELERHLR